MAALAGGTRSANAIPPNAKAQTNFAGLDGSRLPSAIHSQANIGARIITKIDGTDWNQLGGKSNPRITWRVLRSAKRFSDEPPCSYAAQNTDDATNNTRIAADRFRSAVVQPRPNSSHAKIAAETSTKTKPSAPDISCAVMSNRPAASSRPTAPRIRATPAAPNAALRFRRLPASGLAGAAGYSPAVPRYSPPSAYWM